MKYAVYTDVGGRANNEDALLALEKDGSYLFAVADGLGGLEAGEVASDIVVTTMRLMFLEDPAAFDLLYTIEAANDRICEMQKKENKKMKTTITAVLVKDGKVQCAHVGDSRIYLFDKKGVLYQSIDHSVSQIAVYAGEITPKEIRNHIDRNKLTRALGADTPLKIDSYSVPLQDVSAMLLCSDGFWEYVYEEEMIALFPADGSPDTWLEEMRKLLDLRIDGNNDNNTAVAVITD